MNHPNQHHNLLSASAISAATAAVTASRQSHGGLSAGAESDKRMSDISFYSCQGAEDGVNLPNEDDMDVEMMDASPQAPKGHMGQHVGNIQQNIQQNMQSGGSSSSSSMVPPVGSHPHSSGGSGIGSHHGHGSSQQVPSFMVGGGAVSASSAVPISSSTGGGVVSGITGVAAGASGRIRHSVSNDERPLVQGSVQGGVAPKRSRRSSNVNMLGMDSPNAGDADAKRRRNQPPVQSAFSFGFAPPSGTGSSSSSSSPVFPQQSPVFPASHPTTSTSAPSIFGSLLQNRSASFDTGSSNNSKVYKRDRSDEDLQHGLRDGLRSGIGNHGDGGYDSPRGEPNLKRTKFASVSPECPRSAPPERRSSDPAEKPKARGVGRDAGGGVGGSSTSSILNATREQAKRNLVHPVRKPYDKKPRLSNPLDSTNSVNNNNGSNMFFNPQHPNDSSGIFGTSSTTSSTNNFFGTSNASTTGMGMNSMNSANPNEPDSTASIFNNNVNKRPRGIGSGLTPEFGDPKSKKARQSFGSCQSSPEMNNLESTAVPGVIPGMSDMGSGSVSDIRGMVGGNGGQRQDIFSKSNLGFRDTMKNVFSMGVGRVGVNAAGFNGSTTDPGNSSSGAENLPQSSGENSSFGSASPDENFDNFNIHSKNVNRDDFNPLTRAGSGNNMSFDEELDGQNNRLPHTQDSMNISFDEVEEPSNSREKIYHTQSAPLASSVSSSTIPGGGTIPGMAPRISEPEKSLPSKSKSQNESYRSANSQHSSSGNSHSNGSQKNAQASQASQYPSHQASPRDTSQEGDRAVPQTERRLESFKIKELKDILAARGVDIPTGTEKSDLIHMIRTNAPRSSISRSTTPIRGGANGGASSSSSKFRFSATPVSPRFSGLFSTISGSLSGISGSSNANGTSTPLTPVSRPAPTHAERVQCITRILNVRKPSENENPRFVSKSWAYEVLQVRQSYCDLNDVKVAVKKLRVLVHPDKLPPEDKLSADQAFKRINDAASIIEKQIRRFTG